MDYRKSLPRDVVAIAESQGLQCAATPEEVVSWLVSKQRMTHEPVRRYISYLKLIDELALAIAELYDLRSPPGSEGAKEHFRHTGPDDLLFITNHLYVLHSHGVPGCVLECGTSHGYSTCVLSHACAMLGRSLVTADSFEGLPDVQEGEAFFRKGDYAATLENVKQSIALMGRSESVSYLKGWFSDSLKNWNRDIALFWLDVDLYASAKDVLENIVRSLNPRGMIILHEFTDYYGQLHARDVARPPNAVYDVMEKQNVACSSILYKRYLGAVSLASSVQPESYRLVPALRPMLESLDARDRSYRELHSSRTVQWAFGLKRLLLRR